MTAATSSAAPSLHCVELTVLRLPAYLDFMAQRAFPDNPAWADCFCAFPQHDENVAPWDARTADDNRRDFDAGMRAGHAGGVLALNGDEIVGWCNAGPVAWFPMLAPLDVPEPGATGAVTCFVVAPAHRGRGAARALLGAATESLRRRGLRWIVGRPRRHAEGAAAHHYGPLSMYLAAGFEVLHETAHGVVLVRKAL